MFKNHFKAILYRNTIVLKENYIFLLILIGILILIKTIINVSAQIFFFISVFMLINIFQRSLIINFIEDKILKFVILFRIMGMSHKNYILSQIISNMIFMCIFIFMGTFVCFAYQRFDIEFKQIIFVFVSLLFSFALINFNLFISLFFKNPILAIDLSNMITFVLNIITIILIFIESPFVIIMKIIPYTCYYSIIKEFSYKDNPSFSIIKYDTLLLFSHIFIYSGIYYYFETLLRDDNGMNKSILKIFTLIKEDFSKKEDIGDSNLKDDDGENVLVLKNVNKKFDNFEIDNFSYKFKKNKFYCIVGANGAGKSTLLNVASGLFKRDKGDVFFLNKKVESENFPQKIGFCAAENILMDHLTVYQHLNLFSMVKNLEKSKERITEILKIFDLEKYKNFYPPELSGGNRRKICIALSYLGKPELILLDEPSSSLDPFSKKEIFGLLKKLQKNFNSTIICTSHNFDEIEVFPENVIMLNDGEVLVSGHLNDIKEYFEVGHELKMTPKKKIEISGEIVQEIKQLLKDIENIKVFQNMHDISIFLKNDQKEKIVEIFKKIKKNYEKNFSFQISSNLLENAIHHNKIKKNYKKTLDSSSIKKIVQNMQIKTNPTSSQKIFEMAKLRIKFFFTDSVQLATFILVNVFIILFLLHNIVFIQSALPNLSINGCMLFFAFTFVFIEGYNNLNHIYFLVYEKSHNIKKMLFCNGVSVKEYYFSRILADFILNFVLYGFYLFLGYFLIIWRIEKDFYNEYQLFLLLISIFLWKNSFLVGNYLLSFVFLKTNYVIKNFYVIYFVSGGLFFIISSYFPYTYYLSDFCYMFEIASDFENIEKNTFKLFAAPIFQIIFYYSLIIYIENKRLYNNYTSEKTNKNKKQKKDDHSSVRSRKTINLESANKDLNDENYLFEVSNLQKVYANRKISLNKISFKLRPQTCFGLIGPNGAGKSTFFNILISEIQKSTGGIYFHQKKDILPFQEFNFAVTLQNNSLYNNFTVSYHFEFFSKILNIENNSICEELINFFDLENLLNSKVYELTDGAKRKLCIALSLLRRPDFLFYDEATTGIDIFTCHRIQKLIKEIEYEYGTIIILTTHLLKEVDFLCDKIGILFNGRFVEFGDLNDLKNEKTKRILKIFPREHFNKEEFFEEVFEIVKIKHDQVVFDGFIMWDIEEEGDDWVVELLVFFERKIKERVIWNFEICRSSLERLFIDVVKNERRKVFEIKN